MKKKIITILLCTITILSLVGCGSTDSKDTANSSTTTSDSADKKDAKEDKKDTKEDKKAESKVLVDDEFAKITYTGVNRDGALGPEINLQIENKSDKDLTIQTDGVSVDNTMADPIFSCDVAKGKKANDNITFTDDKMDKNFKSVEGKFRIIDGNDITSSLKDESFKIDCN